MANYEAAARTNYFRVTDEAQYQKLFSGLRGGVYDFTRMSKDGVNEHGFGAYDSIYWMDSGEDEDAGADGFDEFVTRLQKILPEGEAFIYMESGNEKLRYVSGHAVVCTSSKIDIIDLESEAIIKARHMLEDPDFMTDTAY